MTEMASRVKAAVERLRAANNEYNLLVFDEPHPQVLGPPSTPAQLAAVEKALGIPLPPSYREFLKLHDGWKDFSGGAMILSSDAFKQPWVGKRLGQLRDHFREFFDEKTFDSAVIVMMGLDDQDLAYFDTTKKRPDGELEVVDFSTVDGEVDRFADFAAYLEDRANVLTSLIEEEKGAQ